MTNDTAEAICIASLVCSVGVSMIVAHWVSDWKLYTGVGLLTFFIAASIFSVMESEE